MANNTDLKTAKKKAAAIDKELTAYDFDDTCVLVEHQDGSKLLFAWAFYRNEEDYYYVFTEHQGYHVFCKDEVKIKKLT